MDQTKIGAFIAALRKEQSMTQRELAQHLGVSDKTVSKWETGRGLPEISIMLPLCTALGVSINELLAGERLDAVSYREKAEEHIVTLMENRSYRKLLVQIVVSTVLFLATLSVFPLAAERLIDPISIPVVLLWGILLLLGHFVAGMTYGIMKKWGKVKLLCMGAYHALLLLVLVCAFAMASVIVFVS